MLKAREVEIAKARDEARQVSPPRAPLGPNDPRRHPSVFTNRMLTPLIPMAIRGVIWYQGEADANSRMAPVYGRIFQALIKDWRDRWGQGDFPFLFVQLPRYEANIEHQNWPVLREGQAQALALPKTAMAVTIDMGRRDNVHPRTKRPIGARLALAARAVAYGENIVASGPLYRSMDVRDGRVVLRFDNVGGGLAVYDESRPTATTRAVASGLTLDGFTIAGANQKFVQAQAVIDGDTVVVSSPDIPAPVAVRYGFENWPECNLMNREGLPAPPFRTDDSPTLDPSDAGDFKAEAR
jgi:sialate O-acetylesterase